MSPAPRNEVIPKLEVARCGEFLALLHKRLRARTVRHSISGANYAADLAAALGMDPKPAFLAGLLHDLGKAHKSKELLARAARYGIPLSGVWKEKPKLLHGPVAAEECRRELGIEEEAIYEAIYWHTTGCPGLGPVALVLYIADYAEPLREHPEAAQARAVFSSEGFLATLRYVASNKLRYVRSKPPVDPHTEAFHHWLHEPARADDLMGGE